VSANLEKMIERGSIANICGQSIGLQSSLRRHFAALTGRQNTDAAASKPAAKA